MIVKIINGMSQDSLIFCGGCSHYHTFPCKICFNTHSMADLIKGICPLIYPKIEKKRKETALICSYCNGVGKFQKFSRISYYSKPHKNSKTIKNVQNDEKLGEYSQVMSDQVCIICQGRGMINQFDPCCLMGCNKCKFEGFISNPSWQKYKQSINHNLIHND